MSCFGTEGKIKAGEISKSFKISPVWILVYFHLFIAIAIASLIISFFTL